MEYIGNKVDELFDWDKLNWEKCFTYQFKFLTFKESQLESYFPKESRPVFKMKINKLYVDN